MSLDEFDKGELEEFLVACRSYWEARHKYYANHSDYQEGSMSEHKHHMYEFLATWFDECL